jgi:ribosomal protein S12 methylthiotransferase accessory factor
VGIVDGEFDQSLAVTPREILALLARGVTVAGSSSMGALRAAELHAHGMRGIGRIFEMYRDEEVMADDEVALIYDPDSLRALTEPLVNVRCAVNRAQAANVVSPAEARAILDAACALPYRARTYRRILADAGTRLGRSVARLEAELASHDQKRIDATRLFREIALPADRNRA